MPGLEQTIFCTIDQKKQCRTGLVTWQEITTIQQAIDKGLLLSTEQARKMQYLEKMKLLLEHTKVLNYLQETRSIDQNKFTELQLDLKTRKLSLKKGSRKEMQFANQYSYKTKTVCNIGPFEYPIAVTQAGQKRKWDQKESTLQLKKRRFVLPNGQMFDSDNLGEHCLYNKDENYIGKLNCHIDWFGSVTTSWKNKQETWQQLDYDQKQIRAYLNFSHLFTEPNLEKVKNLKHFLSEQNLEDDISDEFNELYQQIFPEQSEEPNPNDVENPNQVPVVVSQITPNNT